MLCCSVVHAETKVSGLLIFSGTSPTGNIIVKKNAQGKNAIYGVSQSLPNDGLPAFFPGRTLQGSGMIYELPPDATSIRTVYQMGSEYDDKLKKVYKGLWPVGSLLSIGEDFYGVTLYGSVDERLYYTSGTGTVYRNGPSGQTLLHSFTNPTGLTDDSGPLFINTDGMAPQVGLTAGNDGFIYGVTQYGGANGTGVIFKMLASDGGQFKVIHTFGARYTSKNSDGINVIQVNSDNNPMNDDGILPSNRLLLGSDGYLYGTTSLGGINGTGVIYKVARDGSAFQVLRSFDASPPVITDTTDPNYGRLATNGSGAYPRSGLVQINATEFAGTTSLLGASGLGNVYRVTTTGTLTVIHSFTGTDITNVTVASTTHDGSSPAGELIISHDGYLVGTTPAGGQFNGGALYKLSVDGTSIQLLANFGASQFSVADQGVSPSEGVVEMADGNDFAYYGVAGGGYYSTGTIFKYGEAVTVQQGTPVYTDSNGGGSMDIGFLVALLALALIPTLFANRRMPKTV